MTIYVNIAGYSAIQICIITLLDSLIQLQYQRNQGYEPLRLCCNWLWQFAFYANYNNGRDNDDDDHHDNDYVSLKSICQDGLSPEGFHWVKNLQNPTQITSTRLQH